MKCTAQDPDGDDILCRWAEVSMNECGDVCNAFLDAILDEVNAQCNISLVPVILLGIRFEIAGVPRRSRVHTLHDQQ